MVVWLCLAFCGWLAQAQLPTLPISKANALYPDCQVEVVFVLDVSASVARPDQQTMFRFATQLMIAVEQNVHRARFGAVAFGIYGTGTQLKQFNGTQLAADGTIYSYDAPIGNNLSVSTEVLLHLDTLRYNCTECPNSTWSQLEMLYTVAYAGHLTPTWDGLVAARQEYNTHGDPTVASRFVILITDGIPNQDRCYAIGTPDCAVPVQMATDAVNAVKNGSLLVTIGMNLRNDTQPLMVQWASEPKDILAIPSTSYSLLSLLIPRLTQVMCPMAASLPCFTTGGTSVNITGSGFLDTGNIFCRFSKNGTVYTPDIKGIFVNSSLLTCPLTNNFESGAWVLQYTLDGRGYFPGLNFLYGSCHNTTGNTTGNSTGPDGGNSTQVGSAHGMFSAATLLTMLLPALLCSLW